ncbi:MAG: hypothetical protein V3T39_04510 [Gammaproteobacteria bacterium]
MRVQTIITLLLLSTWLAACTEPEPASVASAASIDDTAREYVHLALELGEHEVGYIDAYIGPAEWQAAASTNPRSLNDIARDVEILREKLQRIKKTDSNTQRISYLNKQLLSMETRVAMLQGKQFSFNEETRLLYDAIAPHHDNAHFEATLAEIGAIIPGDSPLHVRVTSYKRRFEIPPDKLSAIIETVVEECRTRTQQWIVLPEGERFTIEYVDDKPWSGYNWYQGANYSLLQINTDLPTELGNVVNLGCHEGYPGHHVYNLMLEQRMVKQNGWMEFSVQPLFSPQALLMEGSANFGTSMAFPGDSQLEYERDVLFPMAGLDPNLAEPYFRFQQLQKKLSYASNHAAREYLDGRWSREQAIAWLVEYGLYTSERAEKRMDFIDTYRGYVINYNLGRDMVRDYVARMSESEAERWQVFSELLGSPSVPSGLVE